MLRSVFYSFSTAAFILSFTAFSPSAFATTDSDLFSDSLAVEETSLAEMRGTALSPELLGVAVFDAISANNTSNGTVSGGNIIDKGAFSQSSGLSTIIQNSGNNVLIQSATILNVNFD